VPKFSNPTHGRTVRGTRILRRIIKLLRVQEMLDEEHVTTRSRWVIMPCSHDRLSELIAKVVRLKGLSPGLGDDPDDLAGEGDGDDFGEDVATTPSARPTRTCSIASTVS
jgi:hypothetical protein